MNKNKYVVILYTIGVIVGAILGIMSANYYNSIVQENQLLKQEIQFLQQQINEQQPKNNPNQGG